MVVTLDIKETKVYVQKDRVLLYQKYENIRLKDMGQFRGDVEMNWLQPPYSAASCSQHYTKCHILLFNAAAFWLQPAVMNFDIFPYHGF